jgi:integrase/recombinase XerC
MILKMLGHEKLSTTAIYTHVSMDRLRKAYDQAIPVRQEVLTKGKLL